MLTTYVVYADVLLALNFFLDFFLLWVAGRFRRLKISYLKITVAAILGAFYGMGIVLPQFAFWYGFGFKVAFSLLMVWVAYGFNSLRGFLQLVGFFYLTAFAMGGAVLGMTSLLAEAGIMLIQQQMLKVSSLAFGVFLALILGKKGWHKLRQNWQRDDFKVKLEVCTAGRSCTLLALIDTGNSLLDPLSGKPVIVAEYKLLSSLLPYEIKKTIAQYGLNNPADIIAHTDAGSWGNRLRLVPFVSIGQERGMLLGFRPDEITIYGEKKHKTANVIICFYQNNLGQGENYQAVINPEIIFATNNNKEASVC